MTKINNVKNNILYFISSIIFPIALLSPIAMWILIVVPAIIFFFVDNNKLNYIKEFKYSEIMFFFFFLVGGSSLFWTNNLEFGSKALLSLLSIFFSFIVFRKNIKFLKKKKILNFFTYSFLITSLFLFIDIYFLLGIKPWLGLKFDYLFENQSLKPQPYLEFFYEYGKGKNAGAYGRGLAVISTFSFIVALANYKSKKTLFTIFFITFISLLAGENTSAFFAFISGNIILFFFIIFGKKFLYPLLSVIILYAFSAPLIFNKKIHENWKDKSLVLEKKTELLNNQIGGLPKGFNRNYILLHAKNIKNKIDKKVSHRLIIWSHSSDKIFNKVFLGYGVSSSRKFGELEKIEFIDIREEKKFKFILPSIPLHPHNNTIQIWLELGMLGIISFYSFLIFIWYSTVFRSNLSDIQTAFISGSIFCVFIINQISYGLWQSWWISSIILLIIFSLIILKSHDSNEITRIPETISPAPNQ